MSSGPNIDAFLRVLELVKEGVDYDPDADTRPLGLDFAIKVGALPESARIREERLASHESTLKVVRLWLEGKNAPSFDPLMRMLSRAGLLTEAAVEAYWGPGGEARKELEAARQALAAHSPRRVPARRSQGGTAKA